MRVLKWVLALGLPLLAGAAGTAAAAGFPGTYRNDTVTVAFDGALNFFSYQRPKLDSSMTDVSLGGERSSSAATNAL